VAEIAEGWVQGDAAKQRLGLILLHARKAMTATFVLSAVLERAAALRLALHDDGL
jgi:hypothetical protein